MKFFFAMLMAISTLATSVLPAEAQYYQRGYPYGYDEYGRSTDPNCYRGPNQVYVCGRPRGGYGYERQYYRGPSYGYDEYGRSTDPNCYRGRRGVYVC